MTVAWIFPGQGSQKVGMGSDLLDRPGVREQLQVAEQILGWSLYKLTETELNRTLYTQPALFIMSALLSDQLQQQGKHPDCTAGHSLGEYSALYAAGVFDFVTGLSLVNRRAALMDGISMGTMAAVMGFDRAKLDHLCATIEGVSIANDNSPEQVVITGTSEGIEAVIEQLNAKRVVPLAVSGAFHSTLMAPAAAEYAQILAEIEFHPPRVPVYSNVTAAPSRDPVLLKQHLSQQMTSPVQWRSTVLNMAADGISSVWEIGPGTVLTGLVKRTIPTLERVNISGAAALDQLPPL